MGGHLKNIPKQYFFSQLMGIDLLLSNYYQPNWLTLYASFSSKEQQFMDLFWLTNSFTHQALNMKYLLCQGLTDRDTEMCQTPIPNAPAADNS